MRLYLARKAILDEIIGKRLYGPEGTEHTATILLRGTNDELRVFGGLIERKIRKEQDGIW